jgi:hypothetical protein
MALLLIFSILYNPDIISVSCLAVYYAFKAISSLSLKFTLFQSCVNMRQFAAKMRGSMRVWWCRSRDHVREVLHAAEMYLQQKLRLTVKLPIQINRSERGVSMCGYRVLPDTVRLSRRRRQRYALARRYWERAYANGKIDERMLQAAYSSALAITAHADAASWRREQLRINPPEPQCQSL